MANDASAVDPVGRLAEEFIERYRQGQRPSLSEYADRNPELAERIRQLFPALVMIEELGPGDADASGVSAARIRAGVAENPPLGRRVGDYQLLREIGRGGMGVVYQAEQLALRRTVALKVLPLYVAGDTKALERFRREAQAAARLHHSNIVPVFEVGHADGVHYYAMQFIQGQGLDAVLHELRTLQSALPETVAATVFDSAHRMADEQEAVIVPPPAVGTANSMSAYMAKSLLSGALTGRQGAVLAMTACEQPGHDCSQATVPDYGSTPRLATTVVDQSLSEFTDAVAPADPTGTTSSLCALSSETGGLSNGSDPERLQYYRSISRIGVQIADALAYAHERGVLHRDIKPANILLDLAGTAWVTDFGLAKADGAALTCTGDIVGTIRFMAPERFRGEGDQRSDVYALGMTLYELLTLESPFPAADHLTLIRQIASLDPPRPRSIDGRLPSDLEIVVLKAIDKDPARRYQTAAELADDLRRFLDDRPIRARRAGRFEQTWRWCRRNRAVAGLMAVVLVLLAALASGSMVASIGLGRALEKSNEHLGIARQAEGLAEERRQLAERQTETAEKQRELAAARLWGALVEQARARRVSRRPGQRFESLAAIRQAMALPIPAGRSRDELRNEAISALLLPDLQSAREWNGWPKGSAFFAMDPQFVRYALGDDEGHVSVCRLADHVEVARLACPGGVEYYDGLKFSPDGRYLYQRCSQTSRSGLRPRCLVWDLSTSPAIAVLDEVCFAVDFNGDSSAVALGFDDGTVQIHDLPSGARRQQFQAGGAKPYVKWNPVLPRLAMRFVAPGTSANARIRIVDIHTGEMLREKSEFDHWGNLSWHPDGRLLALSNFLSVMIWDTETDEFQLSPFAVHTNLGVLVEFDGTGDRFLTTCWDGEVRLWDRRTGQRLLAEESGGTSLQFSKDNKQYGVDLKFPQVRLFQYEAGREAWILAHQPRQAGNRYESCRPVWLNERLMAVTSSSGVAIVDVTRREEVAVLATGRFSYPLFLESSQQALWIYGGSGILRWPISRGSSPDDHFIIGPPTRESETRTTGMVWGSSRNGGLVVIPQDDRGALLWQRKQARVVPLGPQAGVRCGDVSPDGRYVATGSHNARLGAGARIWDANSGELLHELPVGNFCFVQFSPDSRWLVTASGGIRLWNAATGEEGVDLRPESPRNFPTAFTADSRALALSDAPGVVRIVDVDSGHSIARINTPEATRLSPLSFTPDGSQLACYDGSTGMLHIIDLVAVRRGLRELNLDWDSDSLGVASGPSSSAETPADPVKIRVELGDLAGDRIRAK